MRPLGWFIADENHGWGVGRNRARLLSCWCSPAYHSKTPARAPPLFFFLSTDLSVGVSVGLSVDLSFDLLVDLSFDFSFDLSVDLFVDASNKKGTDGPEPLFSSIVFNGSLQFFRDPAGVLSEASRWLVEGGHIVIAHVQVRRALGRHVV